MANRDCDNRFLYSPISKASQEIRLLQFKNVPFKPTNFEHSPLECCMTPVSLIDAPSYRTLSYVWGVDERCKPLLVNGKLMYITKSLDSAIRHLMLFPNLLEDCIWIDAICIDQGDLDEKSWQVSMMKDIYLNAKSSIGWVGLADHASRLAFETLWEYRLYKAFVLEFGVIKDYLENLWQRIAEDIVLVPAKDNLQRGEAITLFLERQFFARIWIHQEIMAAKHINLVCGTDICDWDSLLMCFMAMKVYATSLTYGTRVFDMSLIQRAATIRQNVSTRGPTVFQLRHFFTQDHLAYNLWPLVVLTRASGAKSSEPRDSIYGLLSVAADSTELQVSAMYKTPVEECFIQAAKAFLEHGYLEILTACQQPRSLMSLPSWVPDFSTRWDDDFNTVTPIERMSKSREDTAYPSLFCVSKGSSRDLRFEERGQRQLLHLAGVRFDSVKRTARTLTREAVHTLMPFMDTDAVQDTQLRSAQIVDEHGFRRIVDATLKQVKVISNLLESRDSNSSNSIERMLRVLAKDIEFQMLPGHHVMQRLSPATLRQYVQSVSLFQRYGLEALFLDPENILRVLGTLPYMIIYRNAERRAFITSNGYLGIGPGTLQEEDIVAIIYGTDVPLLLRPCDGGVYKLLGEAYVDGIMDGEAMEGRKEEVVFVLV